jgi:hypothetical protein
VSRQLALLPLLYTFWLSITGERAAVELREENSRLMGELKELKREIEKLRWLTDGV